MIQVASKSNIAHLRDIINAETFNKDEAIEFLEAIEEEFADFEDEANRHEEEMKDKDSEISNLEDELKEPDYANSIKFDFCELEYNTPNSLVVDQIMESLGEIVAKHGDKKTLSLLQNIPI